MGSTRSKPADAAAPELRKRSGLDALLHRICVAVAELPDRTSPDDEPDMMLVTAEELKTIIRSELEGE